MTGKLRNMLWMKWVSTTSLKYVFVAASPKQIGFTPNYQTNMFARDLDTSNTIGFWDQLQYCTQVYTDTSTHSLELCISILFSVIISHIEINVGQFKSYNYLPIYEIFHQMRCIQIKIIHTDRLCNINYTHLESMYQITLIYFNISM